MRAGPFRITIEGDFDADRGRFILEDTKWLEVAIDTTQDRLEEVSARLMANGMTGLVIED